MVAQSRNLRKRDSPVNFGIVYAAGQRSKGYGRGIQVLFQGGVCVFIERGQCAGCGQLTNFAANPQVRRLLKYVFLSCRCGIFCAKPVWKYTGSARYRTLFSGLWAGEIWLASQSPRDPPGAYAAYPDYGVFRRIVIMSVHLGLITVEVAAPISPDDALLLRSSESRLTAILPTSS